MTLQPRNSSPEVTKVLSFLELLVAARKMKIREIERRLEMSGGTLARIFNGKITLKFQAVLDLLEVLEVSPQGFFAAVFSDGGEGTVPTGAEDLLRRVARLTLPGPPATKVYRAEIKQIIEEVLSERLSKRPT